MKRPENCQKSQRHQRRCTEAGLSVDAGQTTFSRTHVLVLSRGGATTQRVVHQMLDGALAVCHEAAVHRFLDAARLIENLHAIHVAPQGDV